MKQELFKSSVRGRFIKNLLCNTYIPTYDTVRPGDYIIKNCKYVYNISLIKCTKSGTLEGTGEFITLDYTFYWDANKVNESQRFTSNTGFYDSETHEWLGNYLRAYRDMKGINLMPFYNCFSGVYTDRFKLKIEQSSNVRSSLYAVTFRFNETLNTGSMYNRIDPTLTVLNDTAIYGDKIASFDGGVTAYFKTLKDRFYVAYYIDTNHTPVGCWSSNTPRIGTSIYDNLGNISGSYPMSYVYSPEEGYAIFSSASGYDPSKIMIYESSIYNITFESTVKTTDNPFNNLSINNNLLTYIYKTDNLHEIEFFNAYNHVWADNQVFDEISITGGNDVNNNNLIDWMLKNGIAIGNTPIKKYDTPYVSVYQSSSSYDTYTQGTKAFNDAYMEKTPYKLFQMPIKFNRSYTIALDCSSNVRIAPAFINHGKLLEVSIGARKLSLTDLYIQNKDSEGFLHPISMDITNSEFIHPFVFNVPNTNQIKVSNIVAEEDVGMTYEQLFQRYEKYLYLLIQVPKDNESSLVVLEGNYIEAPVNKVFSNESIGEQTDTKSYNKQAKSYSVISCKMNRNTNMINPITGEKNQSYISSCPWISKINMGADLIFNPDGTLLTEIFDIKLLNEDGNPLDYSIGYTEYYCTQEGILSIYSWVPTAEGMQVKVTFSNNSEQSTYYPYDPRNDDSFLDSMLISKLSLLQLNDNNSYPFSDVLIEYLLSNVIDSDDEISDNIKRIQMWFGVQNSPEFTYGAWNNALRIDVFNTAKYINTIPHMDIIGYVDKNVESTTL